MQLAHVTAALAQPYHCLAVSPAHVAVGSCDIAGASVLTLKNHDLQTIGALQVQRPVSVMQFLPQHDSVLTVLHRSPATLLTQPQFPRYYVFVYSINSNRAECGCLSQLPQVLAGYSGDPGCLGQAYALSQGRLSALQPHTAFAMPGHVYALAASAALPYILAGSAEGDLFLCDIARNEVTHSLAGEAQPINAVCACDDNAFFIGLGSQLTLFDRRSGALRQPLRTCGAEILYLYCGIFEGKPVVFVLEKAAEAVFAVDFSGKQVAEFYNHASMRAIRRFCINSELLVVSDDVHVSVFDIDNQMEVLRCEKACDWIECDYYRMWAVSGKLCEGIPFYACIYQEDTGPRG